MVAAKFAADSVMRLWLGCAPVGPAISEKDASSGFGVGSVASVLQASGFDGFGLGLGDYLGVGGGAIDPDE